MPRMPNCQYLSQTKTPDTNRGNAEYHCSKFDWTDTAFKIETGTGVMTSLVSLTLNKKLFRQCLNCSEKTQGGTT